VYWITTNIWTIAQQAIVRRRLGPLRPPGAEQESLSDMMAKLRGGGRDEAPAKGSGGTKRDGKPPPGRSREKAGVTPTEPKGRPSGPPPAPPRRKKKRSGRRR